MVAFGQAASQLAHALAEGHYAAGLLGFGFASFAICWAWTNFTWFASAYDTDEWIYTLYYYLVQRFDPFHVWLLTATAGVVAGSVVAALSGIGMAVCLVSLMLAPVVTVVGYEVRGYRHQAESLTLET